MKKWKAAMAVGLSLSIGLCGAGLVACGGDEDNGPKDVCPDYAPFSSATFTQVSEENDAYWLAGSFKAYGEYWGDSVQDIYAPDEDVRFWESAENPGYYKITLDLYEGDNFKIRHEGEGWVDNTPANIPFEKMRASSQKEDGGIYKKADGMTELNNFLCQTDGKYEIYLYVGEGENVVEVDYKRIGDAAVLVSGLTLDKSSDVINMGSTTTLTPTVAPADATDKTVTWKSSDVTVATVENGVVTPLKEGKVTITCTTNNLGFTQTAVIFIVAEGVEIVRPTGVTVTGNGITEGKAALTVGETLTLTSTKAPANATGEVTYSTSNDKIATVDPETGVITAVSPGTVEIKASLLDVSASVTVKVSTTYYVVGSQWDWAVQETAAAIPTDRDFEETTPGIYELKDFTINRNSSFKIIFLGMNKDSWTGAIDFSNLDQPSEGGKFVADGTNIKCIDSGIYNLTLNINGEKPTLSYTLKEDIVDKTYTHLVCAMNGTAGGSSAWNDKGATAAEGHIANTTQNFAASDAVDGIWTYTQDVTLTKDEEFKPIFFMGAVEEEATVYQNGAWVDNLGKSTGELTAMGITNSGNFKCTLDEGATYTVTLTINTYGEIVTANIEKNAA